MTYYIAVAIVILLTAVSQILLKIGTIGKKNWLNSFLNWHSIIGYVIFLIVTIFNVYALQGIYLKYVTSWLGLSYILVVFLSGLVLKEKIHRSKVIGCILIAIGIFVFTFPF